MTLRQSPFCVFIILLLVAAPLASAQDDPLSEGINYDDVVTDDLTARAFWDWWYIQANAGDVMVVEMIAREPLEPLVGILNPNGELVARSEDGEPGGIVTLEYTVPETAEYVIIATRVGNDEGTSTGVYDLRVRRANEISVRESPYQQVTFRCQNNEVTNALTVEFSDDSGYASYYLISVYGLDSFQPVIRAELIEHNFTDCARDSQAMGGNRYTLPGEEAINLTDADVYASHSAQLIIGSGSVGTITLTVGSVEGAPGRYIAVIEGLVIGEPDDQNSIRVGQGPLAAPAPLTMYMIAHSQSRLDPSLSLLADYENTPVCDDAGWRGCEGVASPVGLSVYLSEIDVTIEADRFDAGVVLPPGPPALREIELGSFQERTTGRYALVLLGELPPRP